MNEAASPRIRKTMVFVLLALFLGQFGSGVYDLIFSNFLRDAQHLDVEMRGLIEFPRELPGILSLLRSACFSCLMRSAWPGWRAC